MRKFLALAAVPAAALALSLAGTTAASASPGPAHKATIACLTTRPAQCVTPDVFRTAGDEPSLEATSAAQNAPVVIDTADNTSVMQDWLLTVYGTVSSLTNGGDGPFAYGLTSQDFSIFHSDVVYGLEFAPAGQSSGFCLANISNHAVLRNCRSGRWQRFIAADGSEFGRTLLNPDGAYGLSVVPGSGVAGHLALSGHGSFGALIFTQPTGVNDQNWDNSDGGIHS